MDLFRILFPKNTRTFMHKRWVKISLRTIHLVGISGTGSGIFYGLDYSLWMPFHCLLLISGILYMLLELFSNAVWLVQLRGLLILLKLFLLTLIPIFPDIEGFLFIMIIIISSVVSHAPGNFRYFSPFYGKRIETL